MTTPYEWMKTYRKNLQSELKKIDLSTVVMASKMISSTQGTVWCCGNGGSTATSDHMVVDLVKMCKIKASGLTNIPTLTAIANDVEYESVYSEQLKVLLQPLDLVVVFSGSGNSQNVLKALLVAKNKQIPTIGFTGFDGGKVGKSVDCHINIPSNHMGRSEDGMLMAMHMVVYWLKGEGF